MCKCVFTIILVHFRVEDLSIDNEVRSIVQVEHIIFHIPKNVIDKIISVCFFIFCWTRFRKFK